MTNWYDLIKTISPTAGTLPAPTTSTTTTQPDLYDWSSLPYYGQFANAGMAPGGFDAGNTPDPDMYVNALLPGQKYSELANFSFQDTFGGHSGVIQNPDGTFTAKRLVQGTTDPTKYEQNTYKLSEDGKSLVPVSDTWTPITIRDSGFWDTPLDVLKEAGPLFLAAYGLPQIAGSLTGTTAATGAATGGAYLSPAEMDTLLASQTAAGGGVLGTGTAASGVLGNYISPAEMDTALANQTVAGGGVLGTGTGAAALPAVSGGSTTPVVPNPAGTSGSGLLDTIGSTLGSAGSFLLNNPGLLGGLLGALTSKGGSGSGTRSAAPLPADYRPLTYGTPSGIFGKYDPTAEELAAPGSQGMFANYLKRELTRGG